MTLSSPRAPLADAQPIPPVIAAALARWAAAWGDPELPEVLDVRFSARLRTTLGRATFSSCRLTLHSALRDAPQELLLEVLCHEAAHVVVWRRALARHDARPQPHGPEWAALVRDAGYQPATRAPRDARISLLPKPRSSATGRRVAHVCLVCHTRRLARRVVPGWRCAACVAAGLDGRLDVQRLPAPHE